MSPERHASDESSRARTPAPSDAVLAPIRDGFARGRERYGHLAISLEDFCHEVVDAVQATRSALGLETTELQLAAAVSTRALPDLYLARACDRGCERAWSVLVAQFAERLADVAKREGARGSEPEQRATALLADLALAPARGPARTRLGTFAGLGALWPWLVSQLVRTVWRDRRRATRVASRADLPDMASDQPPVWSQALEAELHAPLEDAVAAAWKALGPRERLCFVLKHRHRMKQRRIADLMRVPEYTVSRALKRAVLQMQAEVTRHVSVPARPHPSTWEELSSRLESIFVRLDAAGPPMSDRVADELERMHRG